MKNSRIADLRCKEVISICDGSRLGFPCDVEFNIETGKIFAIVVPGKPKFLWFCRDEDIIVHWCNIVKIGDDTILVDNVRG